MRSATREPTRAHARTHVVRVYASGHESKNRTAFLPLTRRPMLRAGWRTPRRRSACLRRLFALRDFAGCAPAISCVPRTALSLSLLLLLFRGARLIVAGINARNGAASSRESPDYFGSRLVSRFLSLYPLPPPSLVVTAQQDEKRGSRRGQIAGSILRLTRSRR